VDLVAVRQGKVVAIGESKLRELGAADLDRLVHVRDLLGAPDAALVLASAAGVEPATAKRSDAIAIDPSLVYG
jgi:hypothetical protein